MDGDPILSLDHVGVFVRDLDRGAARWNRLGFRLSPRSPQMGLTASGQIEPWATANHCAVFEQGYLELIGVHRAECPNPWASFIDRFEGGHITALRCSDAERAYAAIAARCEDFDPPVARRRDAPWHVDGDWQSREMRFRNVFSRDARVPEGRYIVIEHETPEVLWQPALTSHPNGATGLESVAFRAVDPMPIVQRLEAISGCRAAHAAAGVHAVTLPAGGVVEVLEPAAFADRYDGATHPPAPALAALRVAVGDVARTAQWLTEHSSARPIAGNHGRSIWIEPSAGNGITIEFVERSKG